MLESPTFRIDGELRDFFPDVRTTKDLPLALQYWMAHMARDLLQLGVFFRAAGIMLQVPGAGRYEVYNYDDLNDDWGDSKDDIQSWVDGADRDTVFDVLAECLRRLGAEDLMEQVPGAADRERGELPDEWQEYLDRHAKTERILLNVVAECLDALIVWPGMAEIDDVPLPTWWQKWWARM